MTSRSGSARVAGLRVLTPLTATWPSTIRRSPPRRELSPACARILLSLSFTMLGDGRQLRNDQLALDLWQVTDVTQPEGDQKLTRRLEEVGTPGRLFPPGDADETPFEKVVEHPLGVHTANRIDLGARHRLLVGHDRQSLQRRARKARAGPGADQPHQSRGHLGPRDHPVSAADLDDLQPLAGRLVTRA